MIVYCANIGRKDMMMTPHVKHEGVEYVYFVDNAEGYESSIWDIREVPLEYNDAKLDAKWYKLHPHLLFPGEDTVWVDGNYIPKKNSPLGVLTDADITLYNHGTRKCLYKEAAVLLERHCSMSSFLPENVNRQITAYRSEGMPEDYGLYCGNVLYRKPEAASFNAAWWEQIITFSIRDQISLPYVLWRDNISFNAIRFKSKGLHFTKAAAHIR